MAEYLVAAAYGEQHAVVLDVGAQRVRLLEQVARSQALLAVGAAAEEHDVGGVEVCRLPVAYARDLDGEAVSSGAFGEDGHVAAVAVQVQKLGVEVHDGELAGNRRAMRRWRVPVSDGPFCRLGFYGGFPLLKLEGVEFLLHLGQGGVVDDEEQARVRRCRPRLLKEVPRAVDELRVDARVFQAHLHVVAPDAAREHGEALVACKLLEVDVPQPRDVVTIGLAVVDEERDRLGARFVHDDAQVLVEARRVLRQVQQDAAPFYRVVLQAAVLRLEGPDGLGGCRGGKAAAVGGGAHGEGVVEHVGSRERHLDGRAARGVAHLEGAAVIRKRDVAGRVRGLLALEAASRAAERAELAVLAPFVDEQRVAPLAHARVGDGVLRQAEVLLEPERDALVGHQLGDSFAEGVVGVVDECRAGRGRERGGDRGLHVVDLAHAIELVAEEVEQHDEAGL